MPSVYYAAVHESWDKRDRKWMEYMQHTQDTFSGFMRDFASKVSVQLDSVSTLFPSTDAALVDPQPSLVIPYPTHLHFHPS